MFLILERSEFIIGLYRKCSICHKKVEYKTKCKCEEEREKKWQRDYKENRKDKTEQNFYNSKPWLKLKQSIDGKYNGMCLYCLYEFSKVIDRKANHHIVEIKEEWERRLDDTNIIPVCDSCHKYIHNEYKKSINNKRNMQKKLFTLLEKYNNELI